MEISRQSFVYLVIFAITSVINAFLTLGVYGMYGPLFYIAGIVVSSPFVIFYMYHIDCLTTGKCNTWSWVYTMFACISLIITTLMSAFVVFFQEQIKAKYEESKNKIEIPNPYNLI